MDTQKTSKRAYCDWFLLSMFFTYQYLLRCCPSVFTNEIRNTFAIGADEFSNFGAYCMLVYSFLQIPFGIALDRIGIRRSVLCAFALCLTGQYLFTHAASYEGALFGRILIGIGGAPAYMSALKVVADSFNQKSCGFFIGITGTLTGIVVIFNPLLKKICLEKNDWRAAAGDLNFFGLVIFTACLLFLFPKKTLPKTNKATKMSFGRALRAVAFNHKVYVYAAFIIGTNIVAMVIAELWGPSFLMAKFRLGEQQAVNATQLITVGMAIGELSLPLIFRNNQAILCGIRLCCGSLVLIFAILIYGTRLPYTALQMLLFLMGLFGAADVFAFTLGAHLSTPQTSGMLMSWINSVGMLGEPVLQKWIGVALDRHWSGVSDANGLRVYQVRDYEAALSVMLAVTIVCTIIAFCMKNAKKQAACGVM